MLIIEADNYHDNNFGFYSLDPTLTVPKDIRSGLDLQDIMCWVGLSGVFSAISQVVIKELMRN